MAIENDVRTGTECFVTDIAATGEWWLLELPSLPIVPQQLGATAA